MKPQRTTTRLHLAPELIRQEVQALTAANPELQEDETLFLDMLEGETDVFEILDGIITMVNDQAMMQAAIGNRINNLRSRAFAYEVRERSLRKLAYRIMEAANLRTVPLPEATLSVRPGPQKVHVYDPTALPEAYWRIHREPNLSAIREAFRDGKTVEGASVNNGPDVLQVRLK